MSAWTTKRCLAKSNARIDIINVHRGIVATGSFPRRILTPLGHQYAAAVRYTSAGYLVIDVFKLSVV